MPSVFQQHVLDWTDCRRCSLCDGRKNVVLARGKVPCDMLFVGEAPGESEDALAKPFIGPAGKLLDQIIAASIPSHIRLAFTNLVACIPRPEEGGDETEKRKRKLGEPPDETIIACAPRLTEFVRMCSPKVIVCVGALARDWLNSSKVSPGYNVMGGFQGLMIDIHHPAFLLRANKANQGLLIQQCVIRLRDAVSDMLEGVSNVREPVSGGSGDEEIPF